jgi:hypothetical protein
MAKIRRRSPVAADHVPREMRGMGSVPNLGKPKRRRDRAGSMPGFDLPRLGQRPGEPSGQGRSILDPAMLCGDRSARAGPCKPVPLATTKPHQDSGGALWFEWAGV